MPAKRNVTSHISFQTWSRRTKLFQTTGGRETTPALRMTTKMPIKQTSFVV